jgi:hypothetical protein
MSAPLAGKFQDHYAVLGVEPKADMETIQTAYTKLAQKFHPSNAVSGNKQKFEEVNQAYEILSDPTQRREFDKVKGIGEDEGGPKFTGVEFFTSLGRDSGLRTALLCVLYDRRRQKPFTPSLSMRHLEMLLKASPEELTLALWAASDDKSSLQITVEGAEYLETNPPSPEAVMAYINPTAVAAPKAKPVTPLISVPPAAGEPARPC